MRVIDSHTGGEPTRLIISGGPALAGESLAELRADFASRFDHVRRGLMLEPRGNDIIVGAMLTEPKTPGCDHGVIFFNNVGMLGMCGHGTIGVVESLRHLGLVQPGEIKLDTPVGVVTATLHEDHSVSFDNVPAYRYQKDIACGDFVGDIAWGGNWFYLIYDHDFEVSLGNAEGLTYLSQQIMDDLWDQGITGEDGGKIDHIEFFGPSLVADSKNFVLCPGGAYDRSPCGTGTSAKLACLFADGKLAEGDIYRQESVTGSVFEGSVRVVGDAVIPNIRGRAWVNADTQIIANEDDPLAWGIPL